MFLIFFFKLEIFKRLEVGVNLIELFEEIFKKY